LKAIAKGIDDITSVSSMAGYDIRTEGRSPHAGACLIHLKNRPDRKLTRARSSFFPLARIGPSPFTEPRTHALPISVRSNHTNKCIQEYRAERSVLPLSHCNFGRVVGILH
jgi:hypothetical protein